jgi:hypothetical protein
MDPSRSVIALSATLLARLKRVRINEYSALLAYGMKKNKDSEILFIGAISLLYLLGLIEYRPKSDSFEYVGP